MAGHDSLSTIIVPIDFSRSSLVAMSLGVAISRRMNAGLLLLHVFTYVPRHRYAVPVQWMVEEIRGQVNRRLSLARLRIQRAGGQAEAVLLDGPAEPESRILEAATKVSNPVLIMGTHSRSGVERFFVGSTAEEVLRRAECPVITVGPDVMSYWHRDIHRVMLGTDLTERSLAPLAFLKSIWSPQTKLSVVHVVSPEAPIADRSWEKPIREHLGEWMSQADLENNVEFCHIVDANIAKAIRKAATEQKTDLLAIGVHPSKTFTTHERPRTAFAIVMSAPCACLSVRD